MSMFRKALDLVVGAPLRHIAYHVVRRQVHQRYVFELDVEPSIYAIKQGAVVASKHAHRDDAPILIVLAWPWARLRPLAYHKEYWHWMQWPFMITIGAVPAGDGTRHRGKVPADIVSDLLQNGWGTLIFPGGRIVHDGRTEIPPRAAGVYNALVDNPGKPLVMITTSGLGRDEPKRTDASGKPIVHIKARVFQPDISCGLEEFNRRMQDHLNTGAPIKPATQPVLKP